MSKDRKKGKLGTWLEDGTPGMAGDNVKGSQKSETLGPWILG